MDSSTCCTICSYRREERTTLYMTSSPTRIRTIPHSGTTAVPLRTQLSTAFDEGLVRFWSSCWTNLPRSLASCNPLQCLFDPHCLNVREFTNAMRPQFSPVSGPLHSPKRYSGIGSHHPVYENHCRFQIVDEALALVLVVCPGARSQSKSAIVRDSNRIVYVLRPEHARHRTEQLLLVRRR